MVFVDLFQPKIKIQNPPIKKIESSEDLKLSSKITYSPDVAKENSEIIFELRAKNTSSETQVFNFEFQSSDILEYAEILPQKNLHIGEKFSRFNDVEITSGQEEVKQFTAKIKSHTPKYSSDLNSYDCKIEIFFGNQTSQKINCGKIHLGTIKSLSQKIDVKLTVFVLSFLLVVSVISAFRTNLLLKQIKALKRR